MACRVKHDFAQIHIILRVDTSEGIGAKMDSKVSMDGKSETQVSSLRQYQRFEVPCELSRTPCLAGYLLHHKRHQTVTRVS